MTTPASYSPGALDEFSAGVNHMANAGRGNDNSVTLGGALQADSDRWDVESRQAAVTPHSVLSTYAFSRSTNGTDGQGFLPNGMFLGSANGIGEGDFDKALELRMARSGSDDNIE